MRGFVWVLGWGFGLTLPDRSDITHFKHALRGCVSYHGQDGAPDLCGGQGGAG